MVLIVLGLWPSRRLVQKGLTGIVKAGWPPRNEVQTPCKLCRAVSRDPAWFILGKAIPAETKGPATGAVFWPKL